MPSRAAFLVLRDIETVGVVLLSNRGGGEGTVELDYVLPRFRDFSVGKFVYRRDGVLHRLGYDRLVASTRMREGSEYFGRVGFAPAADDPARMVLEVP